MSIIGFVGFGVVGQATAKGFGTKHTILFHDKFKPSEPLERVVAESEFLFLCLPTPMTRDYSGIDLTILEEAVHQIAPLLAGTGKILVVKSTVVPGTTARFAKAYPKVHFAMNPEFLREKTAEWDFMNPDRIILGSNDKTVAQRFEDLYRSILPEPPIHHTNTTSAEIVKYMANTYLAMKVIFANEWAEMCRRLGVDYGEVKEMVVSDKRICDSHLDVTPERGFGGKCFPKDIVALLGLAEEMNVDLSLLKQTWEKNLEIRKDRDWEQIDGAVSKQRALS